MKTKYFYLAALASLTLASCSSDDFIAEAPPVEVENTTQVPILFNSLKSNFTRGANDFTGAAAAEKLNGMFVVSGYKGGQTKWADADNTSATPPVKKNSIVFDNYKVVYDENTAFTTESNTNNWEYVGVEPIKHATDNGITKQTIKYWDYSADQYDFIAWGIGKYYDETEKEYKAITPVYKDATEQATLAAHEVRVSAITPKTAVGDATTSTSVIAYKFEGKAVDLANCYVADIVTVKKGDKVNGYGYRSSNDPDKAKEKAVTIKFRQLGTKVRIGLYETVPGYSVKNVKFYTTGAVLTDKATQIVDNATIFAAEADIYQEGTYTVYFPHVDQESTDEFYSDNNQAHIVFAPASGSTAKTTTVDWGEMNYTFKESGEKDNRAVYLGRASNEASYAGKADDNYYVVYLPNETGTNLNLRVDFTLESIDGSGEIIEVKNAKAQVPSIYTTWKPGYAYTYLFKISDNTNGRTGVYDPTEADDADVNSDPAGLYPITFDAVVVNAEDMTQETITTIATPSITTYQKGSKVVDNNEYLAATGDIFVTVNDNSTGGTQTLITMNTDAATANGAALYTIPAGMTEAEVVDALAYQNVDDAATGTILGRNKKPLTIVTNVASDATLSSNNWKLTDKVEFGADNNVISVTSGQALRFKPAAGTYAFVYTKTAATENKDCFEAIKFEDVASFTGKKYRYAYKATTASSDNGTTENAEDDIFDAQKGHIYFKETSGTYSLVEKPFIGQGASNLFTQSGTEAPYTYNKVETAYAQSGIDYYYTTDGQHYTKAHTVAWAETGWMSGLYEECEITTEHPMGYKVTSDTAPIDGKPYYYYDSTTEKHIYCVFLPQSVKGMYEIDEEANKVETTETPVIGQTYFDKYNYNNAVRYAKVIKVTTE